MSEFLIGTADCCPGATEGVYLLQQTQSVAIGDLPVTLGIELQLPRQIILAAGEIRFLHGTEVWAQRRPGQTVDDVPGVALAGRARLETFRMTQRPLELPVFSVL